MSTKIDELIETGLIGKTKGDYIKEKFQDFTQVIEEWSEKANAIVVTEETQKELMAEAREGRLLLKAKRIEVEKVRKSLKEQSLNEGRLIDSVAKYLISLIEPAEKHLELQEKFIEIQEQNKRIQLKADRTELLQPYKDVIDPNSIQLDLITEEAFTTILNGAKFAQENKKAEALKAEQERKEIAKKQELFQKRSLRLAELKQFYSPEKDLILTTETDEDAFEKLISDLVLRKNEYLIEQDKISQENERLKKQTDKQKQEIKKLQTIVKVVQTPTPVKSTTISKRENEVKPDSNEVKNGNRITVDEKEYEILKKRYELARNTLNTVLCFIVPPNLRDLVNKTISDIDEMN